MRPKLLSVGAAVISMTLITFGSAVGESRAPAAPALKSVQPSVSEIEDAQFLTGVAAIKSPSAKPASRSRTEVASSRAARQLEEHMSACGARRPCTTKQSIITSSRLGVSTDGWPIDVYRFGDGPIRVAFIGGIHGGYEWNTILLAYKAIDHFALSPNSLPDNVSLFIIPAANPDGQVQSVGHAGRFTSEEIGENAFQARFNGNGVDLNRNWGCSWKPSGYWGSQEVSAGDGPFSEAETQILRDFFSDTEVRAVVFWHSAGPGVYFGEFETPSASPRALAAVYAAASGYPMFESFDAYSVTGTASDWLAAQGVAAISVELNNHTEIDLEANLAGLRAVVETYSVAIRPASQSNRQVPRSK